MTSKERTELYFSGAEVDHLPCWLYFEDTSPFYAKRSLKEYYFSSETIVDVESFMLGKYGLETISIGPTLNGIAEAAGSEIYYSEKHLASVHTPVLTKKNGIGRLKVIDPYQDGRIPIVLDALNRLCIRYGKTHNIGSGIPGPVTNAAALIGTEQFLKKMLREPEEIEELLEYSVQCLFSYAKAVYDEFGIICDISEPMVSQDICGAKYFRKYLKKSMTNLIDIIGKYTGVQPSLHICGHTNKIWEDIRNMKISGFTLDNCESLESFKNYLGDKISVSGNIDPFNVIKNGTRKDIYHAIQKNIREAADNPRGYIVSAGCQIPMGVKNENIMAVMEAVKLYGKNARLGKIPENAMSGELYE